MLSLGPSQISLGVTQGDTDADILEACRLRSPVESLILY
jgi:hypothetical protein